MGFTVEPAELDEAESFYAEAKAYPGMKENGIRPDRIDREGEDMFIQEERYFEAYARYFGRFIDSYRAEGIRVRMVMPQNAFNSAPNFPSFGTLERGNPKLLETVMADDGAGASSRG